VRDIKTVIFVTEGELKHAHCLFLGASLLVGRPTGPTRDAFGISRLLVADCGLKHLLVGQFNTSRPLHAQLIAAALLAPALCLLPCRLWLLLATSGRLAARGLITPRHLVIADLCGVLGCSFGSRDRVGVGSGPRLLLVLGCATFRLVPTFFWGVSGVLGLVVSR
jgi:hypothetical protein